MSKMINHNCFAPLPKVLLVLPVYNESHILNKNITFLNCYLKDNLSYCLKILIVDNGSNDGTDIVGKSLADQFDNVDFLRLEQKGRGHALQEAWHRSDAQVLSYMDIDFSTDLKYFFPMIESVLSQDHDICVGVRLHKASKTTRSLKREILSRGYAILFRLILRLKVNDAQCGFKAINQNVFETLSPKLRDKQWFFDTELLFRAQQQGMRIKQLPVKWIEDPDSRVKITLVVIDYIINLFKLRLNLGKFRI